jgi:aldose 1-epimerase
VSELESITLTDPTSSLTATFVPAAGMIGTSLADGDLEFLGQRRGLAAYVSNAKTMGIPLLYPWANRLSDTTYEVDGTVVTLTAGENGVHLDAPGIPIHGVLAANPDWRATHTGNELTAVLDYDTPALLASFPFPHTLTQRITLADRTLTIETTVTPTTDTPVPVCFGYHPYFVIPDVPRADWRLTTPAMRHLPVDDRGLPTGAKDARAAGTETLGSTLYDDGFDEVADDALFVLEGGDHRIEVTFEKGYPAAQLFAPASDDLVAIEPMAAPTDALRRGGYRLAEPGQPDTSRFSITAL